MELCLPSTQAKKINQRLEKIEKTVDNLSTMFMQNHNNVVDIFCCLFDYLLIPYPDDEAEELRKKNEGRKQNIIDTLLKSAELQQQATDSDAEQAQIERIKLSMQDFPNSGMQSQPAQGQQPIEPELNNIAHPTINVNGVPIKK